MMAYTFKIGSMIYHESRYWKTENLSSSEVPGWNARYLPYVVTRVTEKTIYATGAGKDGKTSHVQLPRGERPKKPGHARHEHLEADGRQYHSRFHEYFYREIPKPKPVKINERLMSACTLLGVWPPYSDSDVTRAYKRAALKCHPDLGGSHEDFIRLQKARDVALRRY